MYTGVSTACLYPLELEKSLALLQDLGFRTFECFVNTFSELKMDYLRQFRRQLEEKQSRVCALHPFSSGYEPFLLFSDYKRRFWDTLEQYKSFFEAAAFLGAKLFVIHGDRKRIISEEEYFSRFYALNQCAKRFGVTLAQENVNQFRSSDPDFILRMRRALGGEARFVLDLKQAVRAGWSPFALLEAMGEGLAHIHMSDHLPGEDCLLPGCGQMDYRQLRKRLCALGYRGEFVLELYRSNFKDPIELAQGAAYLEPILFPAVEQSK